jgi:hypothetical protein
MINGQGRTELKWKTENYYGIKLKPFHIVYNAALVRGM